VAWFNGIMGVFLRWDVLHNQAARIDDMTMRITSWDTGAEWRRVAASSNPSLKRSANGMARWPSSAGPAAHFALAVQRAMPSLPAWLER